MEIAYLSSKDICRILSVKQQTIVTWLERKQMPQPDIRERRFVRWRKENIEPFLDDPVGWRKAHRALSKK